MPSRSEDGCRHRLRAAARSWGEAKRLYTKSGGNLRVIDATTGKCSSKETSLNCNVQGPQGPEGKQGPIGATGATGPAGIAGYEIVTNRTELTDVGKGVITGAECPPGKKPVGGGADGSVSVYFQQTGRIDLQESYPCETSDSAGWGVVMAKRDGSDFASNEKVSINAYVVCVKVAP